MAGPGYIANRFHHLLGDRIIYRQLDLCLGHKIDAVLRASINLHVSGLASVPVYFGYRDALNADVCNRLPDLIQLEGFDDGGDQLHAFIPAFTCNCDRLRYHFRVVLTQNIAVFVPRPMDDESTGYAATARSFAPIWRIPMPFMR